MIFNQQSAPPSEVLFSKEDRSQSSVIKFPLSIFPSVITDYINACEQSLNLVPDFMGIGLVSAVATLIGNSYQIQIKPGWVERPLFWFALVGHSGIRKTPSLSSALSPLFEIDSKCYSQYCHALKAFHKEDKLGEDKPVAKQLIANDTTIEALVGILKNNPNGVLYHKDELMGWINDLTRYNKGSAEQQWLSIYSDQSIRINRKKDDQHLLIQHPFVNVIGGIQPDVLPGLYKDDRSANGFTSRIAFSFPDDIPRRVSTINMDTNLSEEYINFIERFQFIKRPASPEGVQPSIILPFTSDAQQRFYEWNEDFINRKLNMAGLSTNVKAVISKLEAIMPRLALVFAFIDRLALPSREPSAVDLPATEKAIQLTEYFYSHFLKVQRQIGALTNINTPDHKTLLILRRFAQNILQGYSKEQSIKALISEGFRNAEIAIALNTAKTNISYWQHK